MIQKFIKDNINRINDIRSKKLTKYLMDNVNKFNSNTSYTLNYEPYDYHRTVETGYSSVDENLYNKYHVVFHGRGMPRTFHNFYINEWCKIEDDEFARSKINIDRTLLTQYYSFNYYKCNFTSFRHNLVALSMLRYLVKEHPHIKRILDDWEFTCMVMTFNMMAVYKIRDVPIRSIFTGVSQRDINHALAYGNSETFEYFINDYFDISDYDDFMHIREHLVDHIDICRRNGMPEKICEHFIHYTNREIFDKIIK